jgi:FemAB-related protein (PEP-CTERM system-associated)
VRDRWDRYVRTHPDATFFHLAGWRTVLERAFGHATQYLYAERDGQIEGVLPLARVRSFLFGDSLISTPFCVYGGVVASSAAAQRALEQEACNLAQDMQLDYLEMRNHSPRRSDWPAKDLYVTFRRGLDPDPERNLLAIPRKQRAMIRKGMASGLVSELDAGVERLYAAYSESLRNLGTPVFSRGYLEILREVFGPDCEVMNVLRAGRCVASVMSFYFRDEVLPYYGGGTALAREYAANDFMYWEVMRRATERGIRTFDYGRSKRDSGSYRFKIHWGFKPVPLHYEYHLVRQRQIPDISPVNPKYRAMVNTWRRLPLSLTRLVGPSIARYLG